MAVRLFSKDEWSEKLEKYGCEPVTDGSLPDLVSGEWWRTADGQPFPVMCESTGQIDEWSLHQIIADVVAQSPMGHKPGNC